MTAIVLEHGGDEDEAIAALLHDAVEDHKATRPDIVSRFGDAVARIVDGCTDTDQQQKPPWRQRKEDHIAKLKGASKSVQLVAAADKLHNARSILSDYRALGEALWARFNAARNSILWYYRSVAEALTLAPKPLAEELGRVVAEVERLAMTLPRTQEDLRFPCPCATADIAYRLAFVSQKEGICKQ